MSTNQEFTFPHEKDEAKAEEREELQIEVVDDTPPEDKNREPMPKEIVEDLEKDDLEEYSEKVKKRLGQLKKVWHDERRAKESATREREEALRFAETQVQEVQNLKKRLGVGEKLFIQEVTKASTNELATAREKLKSAFEAGDAEQIASASEALADAKLKSREYSQLRPSLQEDGEGVEQPQQARVAPVQVDQKAEAWRSKNTWFGADEEMTALALGLHEKLVKSGVDPRSDDYYDKVNQTMRKRFPENFEEEPTTQTRKTEQRRSTATVVAPATRSSAPRQVRLTPTQVALAKKFGLSNEAYAREMIKLESSNNG